MYGSMQHAQQHIQTLQNVIAPIAINIVAININTLLYIS